MPIGEGGFSTIEKAEVVMMYLNSTSAGKSVEDLKRMKDQHIKKLLVRKVEKVEEKGKI